jgi:hypothetical protein
LSPAWDPATVRTVLVDVSYDDPGHGYHRELRLEFAGTDVAVRNVHLALHDRQQRAFRHRSTIVGTDGQVRQTDYVTTTDTLLPIS